MYESSRICSDINFEFRSNDDIHNGQNDGVRGVAFDNISLQEFSFTQDAVYSTSVVDLDAEENRTITVSNHDFVSGVYMIEVESLFRQHNSWNTLVRLRRNLMKQTIKQE